MDKTTRIEYQAIYDVLYDEFRYHDMGKNHGLKFVTKLIRNFEFASLLDVGCSSGLAVKAFRNNNIKAFGIDVSAYAIRKAMAEYEILNCFHASVMDIPFKDKCFDAVFSCDTLEHIHKKDLNVAIKEIIRVAKKFLFLQVSESVEGNKEHIDKARLKYPRLFRDIPNLHLTVMKRRDWIEFISRIDKGVKHVRQYKDLMIFEKKY